MLKDIFSFDSFLWLSFQQLLYQILRRIRCIPNIIKEQQYPLLNILHDISLTLLIKRRPQIQQLIKHNPQTVNIDRVIILPIKEHLRTQILQGATDRQPRLHSVNTPPEIDNLQLVAAEHDVFEFEVAVDDEALL